MKLDIYAHCAIDTISIGQSRYRQAGGPACYCGHAARKLKFDVGLHTKFGSDFPHSECLDDLGIQYDEALSDAPTTKFRINVRGAERDLFLESKCEPLAFCDSESDGVLISPVFDEVSAETFARVKDGSKSVFVDPQGFLRRADGKGMVYLEKTDVDLSGVRAIKSSPDEMERLVGSSDLGGMRMLQKRGVDYVLRTNGTEVSLLDGDRLYSLRLPNKKVYDTTGIGDIFSATFACTMLRERDSLWALCFAGGSAQAALETGDVGLQKVPERGATATNASYFYNTVDFKQV